jgi:hypothetical protein
MLRCPPFALLDAERCESGRIDMLGKHASRQRDRGFESHPLRHTAPRVYRPLLVALGQCEGEQAHVERELFLVDSDSRTGAGPCAIEPCELR